MRGSIVCALACVLAVWGAQRATADTIAVDLSGSGGTPTTFHYGPQTGGWQFTLSGAETVTALGFWDEGADGLSTSHQVGLWTDAGTLLAGVTVDNGGTVVSSAHTGGQWIFADLATDVALAAGTYRVGGVVGRTGDEVRYAGTMGETFASGVTHLGSAYSQPAYSGFAFPNTLDHYAGYYGGNLLFADHAVPEPTTLALLGLGLAGVGLRRRRRRLV